jgi:hypothetical protein
MGKVLRGCCGPAFAVGMDVDVLKRHWPLVVLGACSELVYLGYFVGQYPLLQYYEHDTDMGIITGHSHVGFTLFVGAVTLLFGLFGSAWWWLERRGSRHPGSAGSSDSEALRVVLGFGVLFAITAIFVYPITATDLFSYIAQSQVLVQYHQNPIFTPPSRFPNDPLMALSAGYERYTTPYGPLGIIIDAIPSILLGGRLLANLLLLKGLFSAMALGCAYAAYRILEPLPGVGGVPLGENGLKASSTAVGHAEMREEGGIPQAKSGLKASSTAVGREEMREEGGIPQAKSGLKAPSTAVGRAELREEGGTPQAKSGLKASSTATERTKSVGVRSAVVGAFLIAWNPLIVLEVSVNGHNDIAMMFIALLAVLAMSRNRVVLGPVLLVVAAMVKYATIILLPLFVVYALRRVPTRQERSVYVASILAWSFAVVAISFAPFWGGPATISNLLAQNQRHGNSFSSVVFNAVSGAVTLDQATFIGWLLFAGVYAYALRLSTRNFSSLLRACFLVMFAFVALAATNVLGWYLLWPVVMAAVVPRLAERLCGLLLAFGAELATVVFGYIFVWLKLRLSYVALLNATTYSLSFIPAAIVLFTLSPPDKVAQRDDEVAESG